MISSASSSDSNISVSDCDTDPAPLPSSGPHCNSRYSWPQPASGLQDGIELFESNDHKQTAGNIQFERRRRRRWCSSGNITFYASSDDQQEEEEETETEMISSRALNQELNNQLRVKADELMSMFIEHKRRIDNRDSASNSTVSYNGNGVTRGKFYERYMEKRDEKRRNGWKVNREEKDGNMRTMWESVEMNWAKMNAMRKKDHVQQTANLIEEEEEDRHSSNGSLKSVNSKMLNSRSMPSSSSRLSGFSSISKPPTKPPASRSLIISSTPNSDARKENMKPSIGTVPRSKSTSSKINPVKEEKSFLKKGNGVTRSSKLRTGSVSYSPEIIDYDDSLDTLSSSAKDGGRARKKWESVEMHEEVVGDHGKGARSKGFNSFLSFGRRNGKIKNRVVDDCYDREVGFSFSEGMKLPEQVMTPRRSTPTPANFKLKKDHLSESSPKSPRSFFSLSSFRSKGVESKLR